jgi:hypothetical protein
MKYINSIDIMSFLIFNWIENSFKKASNKRFPKHFNRVRWMRLRNDFIDLKLRVL